MVKAQELRELAEVMAEFGIVRLKSADLELELAPGASASAQTLAREELTKLEADLGIGAETDPRKFDDILFGGNRAPEYRSAQRRVSDTEEGIDAP